jgi:hypothetical protein
VRLGWVRLDKVRLGGEVRRGKVRLSKLSYAF